MSMLEPAIGETPAKFWQSVLCHDTVNGVAWEALCCLDGRRCWAGMRSKG